MRFEIPEPPKQYTLYVGRGEWPPHLLDASNEPIRESAARALLASLSDEARARVVSWAEKTQRHNEATKDAIRAAGYDPDRMSAVECIGDLDTVVRQVGKECDRLRKRVTESEDWVEGGGKCARCRGDGLLGLEPGKRLRDCPDCNGTGKAPVEPVEPVPRWSPTCDTCGSVLTEPGAVELYDGDALALRIAPPAPDGTVLVEGFLGVRPSGGRRAKRHVCVECFRGSVGEAPEPTDDSAEAIARDAVVESWDQAREPGHVGTARLERHAKLERDVAARISRLESRAERRGRVEELRHMATRFLASEGGRWASTMLEMRIRELDGKA